MQVGVEGQESIENKTKHQKKFLTHRFSPAQTKFSLISDDVCKITERPNSEFCGKREHMTYYNILSFLNFIAAAMKPILEISSTLCKLDQAQLGKRRNVNISLLSKFLNSAW